MSHDGRSQGGGGGGGCAGGPGTTTSPQGSPITLSVPRPDHQRTTNLYVDTPFKHRVAPRLRPGQHPSPAGGRAPHSTDLPLVHGALARTSVKRPSAAAKLTAAQTSLNVGTTVKGGSLAGSTTGVTLVPQGSRAPVISKQPAALTFTKGGRDDIDGESIICSWCGRCRCEACTKPRPPPAAWLCRNKCLCSPAAVVDYASCLCCVKGVLYHCSKDGDADFDSAADHPCSCGGPHALRGWACLALASVPLPCLLCYWPLTAARRLLESTYQRCTSHGCRCPQGVGARHHPPPPPEKRPLHDCA